MSSTMPIETYRRGTTDLSAFAAEIARQQEHKLDVIVDTRRITMHVGRDQAGDAPADTILEIDPPDHGDLIGASPNDHCHMQIADRLGVPKKYYDRMRVDAPALLQQNVNYWLSAAPEKRMVRILDGTARAFLSDRYRRLDYYDLMEHTLPIFADIPGLVFQKAALTDRRLYIRALLPSLQAEVRVGDIVQAGVAVGNSEVGSGSLSIEPYIWRLDCLNGQTSDIGRMRKHHVGRVEDESVDVYADATLRADDQAFFLKVGDLIRNALSEANFMTIVGQMQAAAASRRIEDVPEATRILAQRLDLTEREGKSMMRHLIEGGDLTQWGASNAVTAAAKEAADYDRQSEMEAMGGAIVALPASEWAKIAVAL